jgi:hypothetical protein
MLVRCMVELSITSTPSIMMRQLEAMMGKESFQKDSRNTHSKIC